MRVALAVLLIASTTLAQYCQQFEERIHNDPHFKRRFGANISEQLVMANGAPHGMVLYWGSGPGRAAAALLRALLQHALRLRGVTLQHAPLSLPALNEQLANQNNEASLAVALSVAWDPDLVDPLGEAPCRALSTSECELAGTRLRALGRGAAPVRARLHVRLARTLPHRCATASRWNFYTDKTAFLECQFIHVNINGSIRATMYSINPELKQVEDKIRSRSAAASMLLQVERSNRTNLLKALNNTDSSILFLDYEIWSSYPDVTVVESPPCESASYTCREQLETAVAISAVDFNLDKFAPQVFDTIRDYKPSYDSLRYILDLESRGLHITEAACEWTSKEKILKVMKWLPSPAEFVITLFICKSDVTLPLKIKKISKFFGSKMNKLGVYVALWMLDISCSESSTLQSDIEQLMLGSKSARIMGMLASLSGASVPTEAGIEAARRFVPLLVTGSLPDYNEARALVTTLRIFIDSQNWYRLAVLSENTPFAKMVAETLCKDRNLFLRNMWIPGQFSELDAKKILQALVNIKTRIIFVNAGSDIASTLLTAASKLRMTHDDGYVWIVQEWHSSATMVNVSHYTITRWLNVTSSTKDYFEHTTNRWPTHELSFENTLMSLGYAFESLIRKMPEARYKPHTEHVYRSFKKILFEEVKEAGIGAVIQFEGRPIANPSVRIDEWHDGHHTQEILEGCSLAKTDVPCNLHKHFPTGLPGDGSSLCLARAGDPFTPICFDWLWISTLCALLITAVVALTWLKTHRRTSKA